MKRILVPTDFSDTALKAVIYAAELAMKSGGTVTLLHIIPPDENKVWRPHVMEDEYEATVIRELQSKLNTIWINLMHEYPDLTVITDLKQGVISSAIAAYAAEQHMDLVVMGTTGANGIKEIFMGSVTAGLIGKLNVPLLAVPVSFEMKEPQRILLAVNQFDVKINVIDPVISVANYFNSQVHVAVFVDTDEARPEDFIINGRQLESFVNQLRKEYSSINFVSRQLDGHEFEQTMEQYFTEQDINLVAMIPQQKKLLERITGKSATKKMAFHSTFPLLVLSCKY